MNTTTDIPPKTDFYETKHSMKRRSPWHDYHRQGTYMLTLAVEGRIPLLGTLTGNADAPIGSPSAPKIELSALGTAILTEECEKIHRFYPMVEVWQLCIMPDHIHMILRIKEDMPPGCHLGRIVRGFKTGCSRAWWRLAFPGITPASRGGSPCPPATAPPFPPAPPFPGKAGKTVAAGGPATGAPATVSPASPGDGAASPGDGAASPGERAVRLPLLFEPDYNDKILLHDGQLDRWKAYLADNPRRLAVKRAHPQYFTVLHDLTVAGRQCQAVGNRFLLDIPDKVAVIVHRRYTDADNARLRAQWLACGERGGVLVSAAIAPKEKEVLREAMDRGYRIILLRENGFPPLYKPSGESFDACSEGRLLQLSPWLYHMERKVITRAQCLSLNALTEEICG